MRDIILIGGCPRSGTTWLVHALNADPAIFITNEARLLRVYRNILDGIGRGEIDPTHRVDDGSFVRPLSRRESWTKPDYARNVIYAHNAIAGLEALYLDRATELGKRSDDLIIGDKWPYVFDELAPEVAGQLNARYIHLTRHPLDAISSMKRRTAHHATGKDDWGGSRRLPDMIDDWQRALRRLREIRTFMPTLHLIYEGWIFDPDFERELLDGFFGRPVKADIPFERRTDLHFDREWLTARDIRKIERAGLVAQYDALLREQRPKLARIMQGNG